MQDLLIKLIKFLYFNRLYVESIKKEESCKGLCTVYSTEFLYSKPIILIKARREHYFILFKPLTG